MQEIHINTCSFHQSYLFYRQLAQRRQFSHGSLYKPSTDDVKGIVDLSDYKALEEQDSRINELRLCGLTDEEIQLKLHLDSDCSVCRTYCQTNFSLNFIFCFIYENEKI